MNIYLIDGNSYFYRAYHAIRGLSTSKGLPTNAIYGFTNMILKILKEKKPDGIAVVFDSPVPTERHRIYKGYKAHRPKTPDDLIVQIPYIKEIINAFKITSVEEPGFEADDVICSIAKKTASEGANVFILSGDKDMMQAVGRGVKIYDPMKNIIIDEGYVKDRFGLPPERLPELMAITGDAVDNIPGVKGIGEKTAKELLLSFENLDDLLAHPERIKKERIRKMIIDNIEEIRMSKTLVTIDASVKVDLTAGDLKIKEPDWAALTRMFNEFEFKRLANLAPPTAHKPRGEYFVIKDKKDLMKFLQ
ncbi:MAG: hypothetical protein L0Y62_02085 [Nitrospirae bacterium]|nr:hypothetical protein [Nitrospirota bacterium]